MKIKEGFVLRSVAGSNIVVPLGSQISDFGSIIKLSETGAFLWNQLQSEKTIDELVDAITSEYDVDREKAIADIEKFVNNLKANDLLI